MFLHVCCRFFVKYCTFADHSEVHHLGGGSLVLIGIIEKGSAEVTAVHSRIVKAHIVDIDGGILQVRGISTAIPVHAVTEAVVDYDGRLAFVVIDLCKQHHNVKHFKVFKGLTELCCVSST